MNPLILVEGWADRLLLLALRFEDEFIIHQKGKFKIAGAMEEKYKDRKAVGIIDRDKMTRRNQSPFLNSFVSETGYALPYLERKVHPENRWHFLIVLCPRAIETWSIDAANQANINLANYNLPNDSKKLGRIFKDSTIDHDNDVWEFFKALDRANPPQVETLRSWLNEIQSR